MALRSVLITTLLLAGIGHGTAQSPDFLILANHSGAPALWGAMRSPAPPKPLVSLAPGFTYQAMTEGPGDDSVYILGSQATGSLARLALLRASPRGVTTLGLFPMSGHALDMDMDDAGDLRFLFTDSKQPHTHVVCRVTPGAPTPSIVASFPTSLTNDPLAYAEELATGDLIVLEHHGKLHRVTPAGTVITAIAACQILLWSAVYREYGLTSDPVQDDFIFANSVSCGAIDRRTFKDTYWPYPWAYNHDVHYDPKTQAVLTVGRAAKPPPQPQVSFYAVCRGGTVLLARAETTRDESFTRIRPAFGRRFTPLAAPVRGTRYPIRFRIHDEPGGLYQAALSFGYQPGIATAIGRIPIAVDALYHFSLQGGRPFHGIAGRLDANGAAVIGLDIPANKALQGLRLHLAAVTIGRGAIRSISGPHSFTIR